MIKTFLIALALSGSLPSTKYRAMDNNGAPISGAVLYFYAEGTSTPQSAYTDSALTVAITSATSDGNGWFDEIYLSTTLGYKIVLKDADDATIWTVDNIYANQLASSSLLTRFNEASSNPMHWGAAGDGSTDDCAGDNDIQQAIDNASRVIDLLGKTYRCDSSITLAANNVLQNGTLDFSNSTSDDYIVVQGSQGAANLLTSDAAVGDTTIAVTSATGLAAGDWLRLYSDDVWANSKTRGEIVRVQSIAALVVTLDLPLLDAYTTANSAAVKEITTVADVTINNVTILGSKSASGEGNGIMAEFSERLRVLNSRFNAYKGAGIILSTAIDAEVRGCNFHDKTDTTIKGGVFVSETSQNVLVTNSTFTEFLGGVQVGGVHNTGHPGVSRYVTVSDSKITSATPLIVNSESQHTLVEDSFILEGTMDINAADVRLINNSLDSIVDADPDVPATASATRQFEFVVSGNKALANIDYDTTTTGTGALSLLKIENNSILNGADITVDTTASGGAIANLIISGNSAGTATSNSDLTITSGGTVSITEVLVSNNVLDAITADHSSGGTGVIFKAIGNDAESINVNTWTAATVSNNYVDGSAGIDATSVTNFSAQNNTIVLSSTGTGIATASVTKFNISGNYMYSSDNTGYGVQIGSALVVLGVINNNLIVDVDETALELTLLDGTKHITITGNTVDCSTYCGAVNEGALRLVGFGAMLTITGNSFRGTVEFESDSAADDFEYVTMTGNSFSTGTYSWTNDQASTIVTVGNTSNVTNPNLNDGAHWVSDHDQIQDCIHAFSIADSGEGGQGTGTLDPECPFVTVDCLDAHGCALTMHEDTYSIRPGAMVDICNISANAVGFSDTGGVSELDGNYTANQYECIQMRYLASYWIETSRSDAVP